MGGFILLLLLLLLVFQAQTGRFSVYLRRCFPPPLAFFPFPFSLSDTRPREGRHGLYWGWITKNKGSSPNLLLEH